MPDDVAFVFAKHWRISAWHSAVVPSQQRGEGFGSGVKVASESWLVAVASTRPDRRARSIVPDVIWHFNERCGLNQIFMSCL